MHSSGFKDFMLKPELLRAIVDCGFEHPSAGTPRSPTLTAMVPFHPGAQPDLPSPSCHDVQ